MERNFMPKKPGFMSAWEIVQIIQAIPEGDSRRSRNTVYVSITEVVEGMPNKVGLRLSWPYEDIVLITRKNTEALVDDFGSSNSEDWIHRNVEIGIQERQLDGWEVWGILVRGV